MVDGPLMWKDPKIQRILRTRVKGIFRPIRPFSPPLINNLTLHGELPQSGTQNFVQTFVEILDGYEEIDKCCITGYIHTVYDFWQPSIMVPKTVLGK